MEKISETKQIIESNAKDAPVKDILWNAKEIQTEGVRIIDPMEGDMVVLRHFFFAMKPQITGSPRPTKQQILGENKKLIEISLWSDGLEPKEGTPIEVSTKKQIRTISPTLYNAMVNNKADYVIQILCNKRKGLIWSNSSTPQKAQ
mgnify:CR=1 FL=1